ncbi:MAG: DUF4177 domain-containing protein [Anaerolineae bacterium]|nr:DUF4177 domain-containing protein [Anaerolineae bacterium]
MTKWEYRVLVIKIGWGAQLKEQHEETLNALGQEGWELTGMAAEGAAMSLVFKRPIGEERPSQRKERVWPSWQ